MEGLKLSIDIPEHFLSYPIPANSLQLLVENAFKHNIISKDSPLEIDIFIDSDDRLVIRNNYQPRKDAISTGIGHNNLIDQYSLLNGGEPLFMLKGKHYIASIPLFITKP